MVKSTAKVIYNLIGFKRHYLIKLLILFQLIFFIASVFPAFNQVDTASIKPPKEKKPKKILPLFDSNEPLNVTLRFNMTQFLKKNKKFGSQDGVLMMHFNETDTINKNVKIKYRGIWRFANCNFPPIQINFKKPIYVFSDSGKIKKMKLVTHCQTSPLFDEYVLREYLVYKLYNVMTDSSFRVRLLKVTYLDTENKKKPITQYGIFIEPASILALRTNSMVIESLNLTQKHMVPEVIGKMAVFLYMVAQWDWDIPSQHNVAIIKPLKFDQAGLGVPVPYDFDLTGIVNAEYAVISDELGLENIRERLFRGICQSREMYQEILKEFMNKKNALYAVVNEFPYLNQRSKKDIIMYLDTFFDQLNKQKDIDLLINNFLNTCKKL